MEITMKKCLAILMTMVLVCSVTWGVSAATTDGTAIPNNNGTVTISGSVDGAVSGQQVTVLVVEDNTNLASLTASDVVYLIQTTSDENGDYSVSFTMPSEKRSGTYDVYIGGTEVSSPHGTDLTYATPEPVPPTVSMGSAKLATNGANAFYYFITITLNNGTATNFYVKHYPTAMAEAVSTEEPDDPISISQYLDLNNISNTDIYIISVLKGIPDSEADTYITSTATLTYTLNGVSGTTVNSAETTLNSAYSY